MKKTLSCILVLVLIFAFSSGCKKSNSSTETTPSTQPERNANPASDFVYGMGNPATAVVIKGYVGTNTDVVIPNEIDGYPVVSIDTDAFRESNITSIVIPDSVLYIGFCAFLKCSNLHTVVMGDNVAQIERRAFKDCSSLENITFSANLARIGESAFSDCLSLKDLQLPTGLTFFDHRVFSGCTSLEKVTIPSGVTQWGMEVFFNCPIKELTFEDGIKSIGQYANFWGATVEEITIPAGVEEIGEYAFHDNLKKVVFLGDAPKDMGKQPFGTKAVIYYPEDSLGWDTTPLKDEYVMIAQGQNSDSNTTDSSNTTPSISKKQ